MLHRFLSLLGISKDDFPLPNLNMLVDVAARHEMCSFMDGFSVPNQIRMHLDDSKKTALKAVGERCVIWCQEHRIYL